MNDYYPTADEIYHLALMSFLRKNSNKTEIHFLEKELARIKEEKEKLLSSTDCQLRNKILKEYTHLNESLDGEEKIFQENLIKSLVIKERSNLKFQQGRLDRLIMEYNVRLNRLPKETLEEVADFSESKGTEKLIFLNELGILDILLKKEPFKHSTNALASALSGVTGIKASTLQSYLNPIVSKSADQKNNPLEKEERVKKIRQTLINLGYNPSE